MKVKQLIPVLTMITSVALSGEGLANELPEPGINMYGSWIVEVKADSFDDSKQVAAFTPHNTGGVVFICNNKNKHLISVTHNRYISRGTYGFLYRIDGETPTLTPYTVEEGDNNFPLREQRFYDYIFEAEEETKLRLETGGSGNIDVTLDMDTFYNEVKPKMEAVCGEAWYKD